MKPERTRKRDVVDRMVLTINVFALTGLTLSYLAGAISPERFWPLAFVGMGYPIMLIITLLFSIYWLFRRKWFLFLNVAFLLVKWDHVSATIKFNAANDTEVEGIKVMSYNVRLFDRFDWTEVRNADSVIRQLINDQDADIVCIQEFYDKHGGADRSLGALSSGKLRHIHSEEYPSAKKAKDLLGVVTFSRYPIIERGKLVFDNSESALGIYTDVLMSEDTVRIYNLHLQSIHLGTEGYAVLDELMSEGDLQDVNKGKMVLSQMKKGAVRRAAQARTVAEHIAACPHPVIVCGDFNDVPSSYTYQTVSNGLNDSFSQKGSGLGSTYVRIPFFRIDNILFSKEFKAMGHTTHPEVLSDHLAVSATLVRSE